MSFKILFYFFCFILFSGCLAESISYSVVVDSIIDPDATAKRTYYLYPGDSTISVNDLYFKEYSSYLNKVMNSNKYLPASIDSAELLIIVRYGIGNPKTQSYSYSLPVFGRTDAGSATVQSTSNTYGNVGSTYVSGTTTSSTTIKSKPTYGVVATNTYSGTYTTYFRYVILEAIDWQEYAKTGSANTLWKTTITSEGSSNDLRLIMPVMFAGASNYVGKNTFNKIEIDLQENDPRILSLKNSNQIK